LPDHATKDQLKNNIQQGKYNAAQNSVKSPGHPGLPTPRKLKKPPLRFEIDLYQGAIRKLLRQTG